MIITSQNDEETYDDLGSVAEISTPELKRPSLYRVILLNDDYTPMEFVIEVLKIFFGMDAEKATQVMLKVHTEGKGVCGVYTRDIAESKAAQVNDFSKSSQQPLLCEIEVDG
jgi:ATP-dependent Clp protease adaptor protein ClpS